MNKAHISQLNALLFADPWRVQVLTLVSSLALPDCWVAAGFVRNLVWDHLHKKQTRLNDVDVIYYCQTERNQQLALEATTRLSEALPKVNWQVKNQAVMHRKNGHTAYTNCEHAMTYWPEKETAIGIRLEDNQRCSLIAPFGLASLFNGQVNHNPKCDKQVFLQRVEQKRWRHIWPKLQLNDCNTA